MEYRVCYDVMVCVVQVFYMANRFEAVILRKLATSYCVMGCFPVVVQGRQRINLRSTLKFQRRIFEKTVSMHVEVSHLSQQNVQKEDRASLNKAIGNSL
jgi:hypothetical protein